MILSLPVFDPAIAPDPWVKPKPGFRYNPGSQENPSPTKPKLQRHLVNVIKLCYTILCFFFFFLGSLSPSLINPGLGLTSPKPY